MAMARLLELACSRRNLARFEQVEEGAWSRRTFPIVAGVHSAVIGGTFVAGSKPRPRWLACLGLLQVLRVWVLVSLGERWSARGAVPVHGQVVSNGPYRYLRHPNYAVVLAELAVLPMAFGLRQLAIVGTMANAAVLAVRIRDEERLLFRLPGYKQHFGRKRRLIPGVF